MAATHSRIDWLSFTMDIDGVPLPDGWKDRPGVGKRRRTKARKVAFTDKRAVKCAIRIAEISGGVLEVDEETIQSGRPPYSWSVAGPGVRVFYGQTGPVLVEVSGAGCLALTDAGMMFQMVAAFKDKLTRIDHCTDIETSITPPEFVGAARRKARAKSHIVSETGETCYVGSMQSNRYARVYRYAPPHPRAQWLRVEHVFRKEEARVVAALWLNDGDDRLAADCGHTFGWGHETWTPTDGKKIKAWKPNSQSGKKLAWFARQVVPALSRGLTDGSLTTQEIAGLLRASLSATILTDLASDLIPSIVPSADR